MSEENEETTKKQRGGPGKIEPRASAKGGKNEKKLARIERKLTTWGYIIIFKL